MFAPTGARSKKSSGFVAGFFMSGCLRRVCRAVTDISHGSFIFSPRVQRMTGLSLQTDKNYSVPDASGLGKYQVE